MKFAAWGLIILLASPAAVAAAKQTQQAAEPSAHPQDALAAAARRAREQKKKESNPPKVWDNDNIPKNPGALSVVGQPAPAAAPAGAETPTDQSASATAQPASAASPAQQKSALQTQLAAAKDNLQSLQNDADILQRKLALDQQTYYSNPNFSSDKAGAAALQDEQDQIDAKQQQMGDVQKQIVDLQAKLDALSASNSGSTPAK
jgi:hypothetical protein